MGFISHFLAGGLFNRSEMNKKLDEIEDVLSVGPWKLIAKIDNTVGYSGEWTAPDLFGDGSPYDLGAYMIGGGGGGGAHQGAVSGGAAGFGRNFIIKNVLPNTLYAWVIGKGGAGFYYKNSGNSPGNNGGTTSFDGVVALGGCGGVTNSGIGAIGGQNSDSPYVLNSTITELLTNRKIFGCVDVYQKTYASDSSSNTPSGQSAREGQNAFDPTMITLCAGAAANTATVQTLSTMPDGTSGGSAATGRNSVAGNATGYGNGGGGCSVGNTGYCTSGAGSDGVIFLYARKAVNTNA